MFSGIINYLDSLDKALTVTFNFDGGAIADFIAVVLSSRCIWIPVGLVFVYKLATGNGRNYRRMAAIILGLALVVTVRPNIGICYEAFFRTLAPLA